MSNNQDPNISNEGGEDDSEAEDFEVQASDFVILAARNEDEVSHIEVCTKHVCVPSIRRQSHPVISLFEAVLFENIQLLHQSACFCCLIHVDVHILLSQAVELCNATSHI